MALTDIFIKRPVLSVVVSLLILLIGLRAASVLPIRQYPKLSNTVVNVTTVYPGASANLALAQPATGNPRVWVVNQDNDSVSVFDAVTRARLAAATSTSRSRTIIGPRVRMWNGVWNSASASIVPRVSR